MSELIVVRVRDPERRHRGAGGRAVPSARPVAGSVAGEVTKLKQREGGPILVAGSQTLVHFLIENDLVDE